MLFLAKWTLILATYNINCPLHFSRTMIKQLNVFNSLWYMSSYLAHILKIIFLRETSKIMQTYHPVLVYLQATTENYYREAV